MARTRDDEKSQPAAQRDEAYSILNVLHSGAGALDLAGVRVIIMTEPAYVFLLRVIHEHAPHVVKYAFYDMGYRAGMDLMSALKERAKDAEGIFKYFVETYRQAGYGDIEVTDFDLGKPEATLQRRNLFEAEVAAKSGVFRTPRSVDHYSRGIFAGFLSSLVGHEVVCEETRCQYRGDEFCEFVILPFEG